MILFALPVLTANEQCALALLAVASLIITLIVTLITKDKP